MSKKNETKLCKHCKSEIPAGAKVCPHCRKKQGGKLKWFIIAILLIAIIGAVSGGESSNSTSNSAKSNKASGDVAEITPTPIEYTSYSVNEMMQDLDDNAISASDKYKDQYIEITGRLDVIDSSGEYISLYPDNDFVFTGVKCYIKNDDQRTAVSQMKKGDTITLRGKCKSVGEVLGYTLDIDSIN